MSILLIKMHEPPTKCSSNKGFCGNSSILPRTNFGGCGQESCPQSLIASTRKRYRLQKMTLTINK